MSEDSFLRWISEFIRSTGSTPERTAELLAANRRIICDGWHATYEELCEVTNRLISRRAVPRFPDAVTNAIGMELDRLRAEREPKAVKSWAVPYPIPSPSELETARRMLLSSGWVTPSKPKRRAKK